MLICTTCWQPFSGCEGTLHEGQPCPKIECTGELADIDELLVPAIILLNEKGYYTKFCCAGHFFGGASEDAYIFFEDFVDKSFLTTLPTGFEIDEDQGRGITIRCKLKAKGQRALHRKVIKAALDVLEWAEKLPPIPEDLES